MRKSPYHFCFWSKNKHFLLLFLTQTNEQASNSSLSRHSQIAAAAVMSVHWRISLVLFPANHSLPCWVLTMVVIDKIRTDLLYSVINDSSVVIVFTLPNLFLAVLCSKSNFAAVLWVSRLKQPWQIR